MKNYLHNRFNSNDLPSPIVIPHFSRTDLAKLFAELKFTKGAEIGVKRGEYSRVLCEVNKDLEHICVDPWKKYSSYDGHLRSTEKVNKYYSNCLKVLSDFNVRYIIKKSEDAVKEVELESLDFVHIDANHSYEAVKFDVENWSLRVRVDGIISGHDYLQGIRGVFKYINELIAQGVEVFVTDETIPSWFFAKGKD